MLDHKYILGNSQPGFREAQAGFPDQVVVHDHERVRPALPPSRKQKLCQVFRPGATVNIHALLPDLGARHAAFGSFPCHFFGKRRPCHEPGRSQDRHAAPSRIPEPVQRFLQEPAFQAHGEDLVADGLLDQCDPRHAGHVHHGQTLEIGRMRGKNESRHPVVKQVVNELQVLPHVLRRVTPVKDRQVAAPLLREFLPF